MVVPVRPGEVDQVVDADLGGVGLGEVEEGDVAEELLRGHLRIVLAPDQRPDLLDGQLVGLLVEGRALVLEGGVPGRVDGGEELKVTIYCL